MGLKLSDREYAEQVAERNEEQLEQLNKSLEKVANSLSGPKEDKAVADAIKRSGEATEKLVEAIKNIPKPDAPKVSVSVSQDEIVSSLVAIKNEIVASNEEVIKALESRLIPSKFDVVYEDGWVRTVKIVYAKKSELNFLK